jgi:hypothetical protein
MTSTLPGLVDAVNDTVAATPRGTLLAAVGKCSAILKPLPPSHAADQA